MDFTEVFILSDQPTTCPKCGARTDVILDMSHTTNMTQVEECLGCGERFFFSVKMFILKPNETREETLYKGKMYKTSVQHFNENSFNL